VTVLVDNEVSLVKLGAFQSKEGVVERGRMKKRLFTDSETEPTDYLLEKQLGKAIHFYRRIVGASGNCRRQWQFNRGNGWILKVHDAYKPMYYLIAFDEGIEISLTVRDIEREDFLKNTELEASFPELADGKKYSGGYALRFEIENEADCSSASRFLENLMKTRMPMAKPSPRKRIKMIRDAIAAAG